MPRAHAPNELDAFMEKVLARRDVNRKMLEEYILNEAERFDILGPGLTPLHRTRREYTWYVRDGMHVRSPLRFNGVSVGEGARERYEANWIRRERERRERKAKNQKESREVTIGPDGLQVGGAVVPTEPRFVSEAYFLQFKFEPGNYYLAGRETLEGHDVLRIEYYPTRMFGDDDAEPGAHESDRRSRRRERRAERDESAREQDIDRRMNKTALITLWIDPAEHQIVRYIFENVWLDFLPGAWLVRMDEIRASMTMGQPFPGVWLPREMQVNAGVTLASGSFAVAYERLFSEYRLAEVKTKIGPPGDARPREIPRSPDARRGPEVLPLHGDPDVQVPHMGRGPFVGDTDVRRPDAEERAGTGVRRAGQEVVGEIRVHGNAFVTDEEVLALAGISVGQVLPADGVDEITERLKNSRLFDAIEVRKRYRSLIEASDIALVLVVHERPGVRSATTEGMPGIPRPVARTAGRLRSTLMFLPIVGYDDGYGFTYGGRASTVDLLGGGERLSVPLSWGGTRRAAIEAERLFRTGPLTRIDGGLAIWSRVNPRFDVRDTRVEVRGRVERVFAAVLRAGLEATRSTISFGALDDRLWTIGTSLALDTRADPAFPANGVYLGVGWTGLHFTSLHPLPGRVDKYTVDGRGYLRVFRQIVLAGRGQYTGANASLPPYERLLAGGAPSLRGFRAGTFDGDRFLVSSAELRVPVTSVLSGARLGITAFIDAARVWDHGQPAGATEWHRGAGAGVFLIASVVRINLDVARGLQTGRTRIHLSSGFAF